MSSSSTVPDRAWLDRLVRMLASTLIAISALTLLGWWLHESILLQPFANEAPLRPNAALGFLATGVALIAIQAGHRRFAGLALFAMSIGLITLAQDIFGWELRIDELLARDHLPFFGEHPGRMASVTATFLVLGSALVAWRGFNLGARARVFAEAMVGSLLVSAGVSTLLGYIAGLPTIYGWGTDTPTPPVAALALTILGLALVARAWSDSRLADGDAPKWSPLPAVIGCLTLTVVMWVGLRAREQTFTSATTQAQMDEFALQIKDTFEKHAGMVEKMARVWGDGADAAFQQWETDARRQLAELKGVGCLSIAYVNLAGRTTWVFPREHSPAVGFDHRVVEERRQSLDEAKKTRGPVVSASTNVQVPGRGTSRGVVFYAPVIRKGDVSGYLAAEFAYRPFFDYIARARQLQDRYRVSVSIGPENLYFLSQVSPTDLIGNEKLAVDHTYPIAGRRIRISLTPSDAVLAQNRAYLPELALVSGIGLTVLLGFCVHLARSARAGQRAAELSNRKLFIENEERRRVEARLKISDERLRLALDSTQIGIFEWSVGGSHVYYSPGLWAMLGYDHAHMPSTVEAWQSLIHPEDLPLYRRRTESQLNGIASFIEPEYRVRARSGDWRWVYTRSKSVATQPDGRPTRIIGTVQDITARREAELALRESQAEARKLSLVAAKTDNPVLIGSPDGRIEWANEAFCRVMEYSLDEVIGKNPGHFMVGPETNPRTVGRIRAAIAQGQGISTDVVNYSKSGRKYHLHVEVQPVRNANGELENFIAVETDITARVETELQLRRAKAEADDASRAKSEFLASMSHEIRTPMNGVIGMTSLLIETSLNNEQRDYVNTIRTSGEALLTIINDILDFSKIESGKMELERAPFELSLCLEDALDVFALQASAKQVEIGYHISPDVPAWLMGDVTRLRQIIVNLVNNAVKFTPTGSISVEIKRVATAGPAAAVDDNRVSLECAVRDTGIGIPPEGLERLFKAFSQVDSSTTRKYGGTGLGLAICQRLCELMNGSIRVESTVGRGSAFIFTIQAGIAPGGSDSGFWAVPDPLREGVVLCVEDHPVTQARLRTIFQQWGVECVVLPTPALAVEIAGKLTRVPTLLVVDAGDCDPERLAPLAAIRCPRMLLYPFGETAPRAIGEDPMVSTSKPIRTSAFMHAIIRLFQTAAAKSASSGSIDRPVGKEIPLEVLLAEDNIINQKVALRFLERLGYRADAVANGAEAVSSLRARHYDLVLMDVQMPDVDGYEATRQIRAQLPPERQPKIIALTANAMAGDRELAVAAGMDDYISKPVKMHEIAAAIRRHFGKPVPIPLDQQLIG
jgi:PAS domain S-box-containing protein